MPAFIISALAWIFRKLALGELAGFVLRKVIFSKLVVIEFIKNLTNPTSSIEVTSVALSVLSSLGVFKAFWDVLNLYLHF